MTPAFAHDVGERIPCVSSRFHFLAIVALPLLATLRAQQPLSGVAYVPDTGRNEIRRVDLATGTYRPLRQGLVRPRGIAISANGEYAYIVESAGGRLSRVEIATGTIMTVAEGLDAPNAVELRPAPGGSPESTALVTERGWALSEFDLSTGQRTRYVVPPLESPYPELWWETPSDLELSRDGSTAFLIRPSGASFSSPFRLFAVDLATGTLFDIEPNSSQAFAGWYGLGGCPLALDSAGTAAYVGFREWGPATGGWAFVGKIDLVTHTAAPWMVWVPPDVADVVAVDLSPDDRFLYISTNSPSGSVDLHRLDLTSSDPQSAIVELGPIYAEYYGVSSAGLLVTDQEVYFTEQFLGGLDSMNRSNGTRREVERALRYPYDIVALASGARAVVTDVARFFHPGSSRIWEVDLVSGELELVLPSSAGLDIRGLAVRPDGTVLASGVTPSGMRIFSISNETAAPLTESLPWFPGPIDVLENGMLLAPSPDGELFTITPTGSWNTVAPLPLESWSWCAVHGLSSRPAAFLLSSSGGLLRFEPSSGIVPIGFEAPYLPGGYSDIHVADDGRSALVLERNGRLIAMDLATGAVANVATGFGTLTLALSVLNTADGGDVTAIPVDVTTGSSPVTLSFTSVLSPGETTLATNSSGPTVPSGFELGTPPTYYEITTTAIFTGPVELCIDYSGVAFGSESTLQLLHYDNGAWVNVTTRRDPDSDRICGAVTSLSPFVVVEFPAMGLLTDLVNRVRNLDLRHGIVTSLDAKLGAAQQALSNMNALNNQAAINALQSFIAACQAQAGHHIPVETAAELIANAQSIAAVL